MDSGIKTIFGGLAVALAIGGMLAWSEWSEITKASETPHAVPGVSRTVLPAGQFFGQAAVGYQAAQQCPEIIEKLFCYCGCDETDQHTSLLDCFTTTHGADCQICTDEAVIAARMKKEGKLIAEIQKVVDDKYANEYPFEKESPALKKYRAMAVGVKSSASDKAGDSSHKSSAEKPGANKLKEGKSAGTCCK
ncbi:MAG: hypothetical protein EKK48_17175 [Candidatus Melainabacteria bacterium]|nr:MAG: hypothetical protein EKK48_17175 [Candidatus Melainabacteria bacterium]